MTTLRDIIDGERRRKAGEIPHRGTLAPESWSMDEMMDLVSIYGRGVCPGFRIDADNRDLYEQLVLWTVGSPLMRCLDPVTGARIQGDPNKGIYIGGMTGRGKSVALKVLRRLHDLNPLACRDRFGNVRLAGSWTERRADEITDAYAIDGSIVDLKNEPILCIQDFGSEPQESLYMGNRVAVMRSLLEYRGDTRWLTFISSNIPMGHEYLRQRYGDRVQSRLRAMCNYLELGGEDRRI